MNFQVVPFPEYLPFWVVCLLLIAGISLISSLAFVSALVAGKGIAKKVGLPIIGAILIALVALVTAFGVNGTFTPPTHQQQIEDTLGVKFSKNSPDKVPDKVGQNAQVLVEKDGLTYSCVLSTPGEYFELICEN